MAYLSNIKDHSSTGRALQEFRDNETKQTGSSFSKIGKRSFLVFKHNKYMTVPTENIAFFFVKHSTSVIMCFDRQEYEVNYSLDQVQQRLSVLQFYRLNRQHLINFSAVKEVEHYFARKLLVSLAIPVKEQLLVSKEKARSFLAWLENR
jgi:two-component system response regulator LytT